MWPPENGLLAYAASPGSVAVESDGRNSVFTGHLLEAIDTPGLSLIDLFGRVRQVVAADTGKRQYPWESSSLRAMYYLAGEPDPNARRPQAK